MQKSLCQRVSLVELSEHLNPTGELAERRVQQLGVFAEREREANIFITSTTAADVTPEQSQTLLHGCVEIYKFATWGGLQFKVAFAFKYCRKHITAYQKTKN